MVSVTNHDKRTVRLAVVSSVEPISSNEMDQHLEVGADIDDGWQDCY